jgi:FemAB-related protein (PEP-CTERM system-associated)
MTGVLGHRCHYLSAVDDAGTTHGVLPLVDVDSPLFGRYLISVPFLNGGGPLGTPAARQALGAYAQVAAERGRVDLLELRSRIPVPGNLRESHRRLTVILDLPSTSEALWRDHYTPKLRSQIRRAMKVGFTVHAGADQVDAFYTVFAHHMRDLGTPVLPRAFFRAAIAMFGRDVLCVTVRMGAQPVAAAMGFFGHGEFELTWAASLATFKKQAPNMLMYSSCIERCIHRGVTQFNFGRCAPGSGTHRFKQQWGGRDVPLPWAQWSRERVTAPPTPDRPAYRLASAAWRHLPLAMANRMGPLLARQLP